MSQFAVAADAGAFSSFGATTVNTIIEIIEVNILYASRFSEQVHFFHGDCPYV